MITVNGHKVEPTRFPDKTTQVWHLPPEVFHGNHDKEFVIDWRFEREDEFFSVAQLRALCPASCTPVLLVPYLPYARQDKDISNDATFALYTFATLINTLRFHHVVTWDIHNFHLTMVLVNNLWVTKPAALHQKLITDIGVKNVIYPDAGAADRYPWFKFEAISRVVYAKKRDQATGKILGLERKEGQFVEGPCLIVDDICDGGATFLGIHEAMKAEGVREKHDLHLFVTHGIFSKGRKILEDAGIKLWTTNSLPGNPDGMELT